MIIDSLWKGAVVLAPMAGVCDLAFRRICKEYGADITYTEMVSAKALCMGDKKSRLILELFEGERPAVAQLFGSCPATMAEAARIASEVSGADFIDINMGCPIGKIVKNGEGSALMRDPENAARIIEAVTAASPVPVTLKIRRGWDRGNENYLDIARHAEQLGVAAIALHGRTRAQMFSGNADLDSIRELKRSVSVTVIGNGDVQSGETAARMLRYTGCDAVMVGRAAFGRPWIFREIRAVLDGREASHPPGIDERCDTAVRQFEYAREQKGERIACLEARKHYAWYLKGIPHSGYYREKINHIASFADIYELTKHIKNDLR